MKIYSKYDLPHSTISAQFLKMTTHHYTYEFFTNIYKTTNGVAFAYITKNIILLIYI